MSRIYVVEFAAQGRQTGAFLQVQAENLAQAWDMVESKFPDLQIDQIFPYDPDLVLVEGGWFD